MRVKHADDSKRDILDADRLADRVGAIEQVIDRRLAKHGDFIRAIHILLGKLRPVSDGRVRESSDSRE